MKKQQRKILLKNWRVFVLVGVLSFTGHSLKAQDTESFWTADSAPACLKQIIQARIIQALQAQKEKEKWAFTKKEQDYYRMRRDYLLRLEVLEQSFEQDYADLAAWMFGGELWSFKVQDHEGLVFSGSLRAQVFGKYIMNEWSPSSWTEIFYCRLLKANEVPHTRSVFQLSLRNEEGRAIGSIYDSGTKEVRSPFQGRGGGSPRPMPFSHWRD